MKFCAACEKEFDESKKFCRHCGAELVERGEAPSSVAEASPGEAVPQTAAPPQPTSADLVRGALLVAAAVVVGSAFGGVGMFLGLVIGGSIASSRYFDPS